MTVAIAAVLLCSVLIGFSGCKERYKEFETEYFKCREYKDRINIPELTYLGKEQEILIVPEKIRGKPVALLGETAVYLDGAGSYSRWKSDKLKKLFLKRKARAPLSKNCFPSLEGIYVIGLSNENGLSSEMFDTQDVKIYVPNIFENTYNHRLFTANVGYLYNYDESPQYDYYWIDYYAYGAKINYIPPVPERNGYIFSGWYKEAACVLEWNFDFGTLPAPILDEDGVTIYQELKLYAKWIKN